MATGNLVSIMTRLGDLNQVNKAVPGFNDVLKPLLISLILGQGK